MSFIKSQIRFYSDSLRGNIKATISRLQHRLPEDFHPGSKTALVLATNGCKEGDIALTTYILRRAGIVVTIAGLLGYDPIRCARRMVIKPDTSLDFAIDKKFDIVIVPGGADAVRAFGISDQCGLFLKRQEVRRGIIGAIGLGTLVLCVHGIYGNRNITGHPTTEPYISNYFKYKNHNIVVDDPLMSCRSTVHALDLSLIMVEIVSGKHTALTLAQRLYFKYRPHTLNKEELAQWTIKSRHFDEA